MMFLYMENGGSQIEWEGYTALGKPACHVPDVQTTTA